MAGATAVVIGAGFTAVGLNRQGSPLATRTAADSPFVATEPTGDPGTGTDLLDDALPPSSAVPSPAATSATPATKAPTAASRKPKATPTKRTTPPTTAPAKRKNAPVTSGSILDQVLDHINAARGDEGLAALSLDTSLSKAAALHNQRMIDGCGLSHQCSGEGGIGERFSAQGVPWRSAGENIGFGFAGDSDAAIAQAANGLCDSMLAEVPPEDGHRKNLLSKDFTRIGLSVVRESGGKVWLTQDFVG
ncbi:CAP domain-containing protein [Actinoplanes sp. NPDC049599]|uniref:CAP domain-containing protein n=1 Tax=Actinoplanes sp. NPDC049599 TaxID=3363903 RepID=UPI00378ECCCB